MSRLSKKLFALAIKRSIIVLSSRDYLLHHPTVPPTKKPRIIGKNDEKASEKPEKKEKKVKVRLPSEKSDIQGADKCNCF